MDCEVPLTDTPPIPEEHPDLNLVTVLDGADPGAIALAESLLMEQKIPYVKKGDQLQELFGRIGGVNPVVGPVLIQVPEEHAEAARDVLGDLREGILEPFDDLPAAPG
ncbi:MAG TPA: hypothetical protein VN493_01670 [Thermoanaerobaculia bacterium]|nr:hypothetical protein [Thermoanaerobaculia bacterium]